MNEKQNPTYFRATSNVGFHKIFCTEGNEDLVLQLLNAVIDDRTIESFKFLDTTHAPNNETYSTFDLYCECSDGDRIIVECQNVCDRREFMNRALAYSSMAILDRAHKNWHYDFDKIYFVGLLNYNHFVGRRQAVTKVMLQSIDDDHIVTNDNYLQIFIELPKLAAGQKDGSLFLRALRDVGRTLKRQDEYVDSRLDSLFNAARYNILSDEEREKYERDMTTIDDIHGYYREEMAREMAREGAEKLAEGLKKGLEKAAKNLLAAGIDIAVIASCTGLNEEQIKAL